MVGDAGMVVIQISRREVCPRAGVSRGDRGTMLEQVEGPVVILDRVTASPGKAAKRCDRGPDGIQGDVLVGVDPTESTYEVADVEVEQKEEGCQAVRPWLGDGCGGCADGAHRAEDLPVVWGLGRGIQAKLGVCRQDGGGGTHCHA